MGIELRPLVMADVDAFESEFSSLEAASEFQWFGFTNLNRLRDAVTERGALGGTENTLAVYCDGRVAGRADWFQRSWGRVNTSSCWEIAVGLLPHFRGKGVGKVVHSLLVNYLFCHMPQVRIQATTDPENMREIQCLRYSGFELEGEIRACQWRGGAWHNQLIFSILRQDVV